MRGRRGGRIDNNQREIVYAYRTVGASVLVCPAVATGFPDLIVGFRNINYLVEVKNPKTKYGRKGLSESQKAWAAAWGGGRVHTVTSVGEALAVIGLS